MKDLPSKIIEKRANEIKEKWEKDHPYFFTDNGWKPSESDWIIRAILEYLDDTRGA